MNLILIRYRHREHYIEGSLRSKDEQMCSTLENASTCLPEGTYTIRIVKCHQHARKMLLLGQAHCNKCPKLEFVCHNTTMPRYCPMLTPGNGAYGRTDGSILIGEYGGSGILIHPKETFIRIYDILRKSSERGHRLTLTIKNSETI